MAKTTTGPHKARTRDDTDALIEALQPILSRVRKDVTAVKTSDGSRWTSEGLTRARMTAHLTGGKPRGVCPILAGESTTRLALLDFDSHKGETPWPQMADIADQVMAALDLIGVHAIPFRSSGGNGIHLYMLWDEPQDAYSVRTALIEVLQSVGLNNGAKGVAHDQVEAFPKQDEVPPDGFGNQFILPLAGASVPLEHLLGLEPMDASYVLCMDWPLSAPVPVRERPVREKGEVPGNINLETVRAALAAIPNEGEKELDYDAWLKVMAALHTLDDGGADSLELAHEFSSRSCRYDPKFLEERAWRYLKSDRAGGVGLGTIFHMAQVNGWERPDAVASPEDFDIVRAPPGEKPLPKFKRNKKGEVEATIDNVVKAISCDHFTGWRVARDTFRDEILLAPEGTNDWRPFADTHHTELRILLERRTFRPVGREMMRDAVDKVAADRTFDSAILWLEALSWDGMPRCETFLPKYFGSDDTPYTRAVSRYMWTALAGRVLTPGVKADMMPILVGDQGIRKTSAVAAMAPAQEHFIEVRLDKPEEELARVMRGALVAEVGELRGLHNKDHEGNKQWLSRTHEKWVPKFKEFATVYPRRCLFIATTNDEQFLSDPSGNRRYPPVDVRRGDVDAIERDRLQLWAEAAQRYREGGVDWQEAETLAAEVHDHYMLEDPWEPEIRRWLDSPADFDEDGSARKSQPFTMGQLLTEALGIVTHAKNNVHDKRAAGILRKLGFSRKVMRVEGAPTRAWVQKNAVQ